MAWWIEDVSAWLVLLDGDGNRIGVREPCRIDWSMGQGVTRFRFRTAHAIVIPEGREAHSLAVYDDQDGLMFANMLVGRPAIYGQTVFIEKASLEG